MTAVFRAIDAGKRYWIVPSDAMGRSGRLNPFAAKSKAEPVWALRNVNVEIRAGELVGLLGRNGAGKTTLLRLLAQTIAPTEGELRIRGRVGAMLGAEAAFSSHLTGRENCFLTGALLGMRRADVAREIDEIIAFAEIEQFIDTPVRFYSSGMYLRLAIALSLRLRTEILAVDEALNACDEGFRKKAMIELARAAQNGRTVIIVSHDLHAIRSLCSRAILLEGGSVVADGRCEDAIAQMRGHGRQLTWERGSESQARSMFVRKIQLESRAKVGLDSDTHMSPIRVEVDGLVADRNYVCRIDIESDSGESLVYAKHSFSARSPASQSASLLCEFRGLSLRSDWYAITVCVYDELVPEQADTIRGALHVRVEQNREASGWSAAGLIEWNANFTNALT